MKILTSFLSMTTLNLIMLYNYKAVCESVCEHGFQFIEIDHQHTFFTQQKKVFALKNYGIHGCTSFQMNSQRECGQVTKSWYTNGTNQLVVHANDITQANSPVVFNLRVLGSEENSATCQRLQQVYLQLNYNVLTEQVIINSYQSICISHNSQQNPGVLRLILPTVNPCNPDCICPVLLQNGQDCYNFQTCSCIMGTPFYHSLSACVSNLHYLQICISNFTDEMNNTNIHFIITNDAICVQQNTYYSYRKYIKAVKLLSGINTNLQSQNYSEYPTIVFTATIESTSTKSKTLSTAISLTARVLETPLERNTIEFISSVVAHTISPTQMETSVIVLNSNSLVYLISGVLFASALTLLLVTFSFFFAKKCWSFSTRHSVVRAEVQEPVYESIEHIPQSHNVQECDSETLMTKNPLYSNNVCDKQ